MNTDEDMLDLPDTSQSLTQTSTHYWLRVCIHPHTYLGVGQFSVKTVHAAEDKLPLQDRAGTADKLPHSLALRLKLLPRAPSGLEGTYR